MENIKDWINLIYALVGLISGAVMVWGKYKRDHNIQKSDLDELLAKGYSVKEAAQNVRLTVSDIHEHLAKK